MTSRRAGCTRRPACRAVAGIATALIAATGLPATAGARSGPCVAARHGCFKTVQEAVDAARDGDTIRIGPGRFAGGVTVTKSVRLAGAGAHATTIAGGGPVLTIGELGSPSEPTVTIEDVAITGGRTTQGPIPGFERQIALGGGVLVPGGADNKPGATVTIRDSRVRGNRVAPPDSAAVGPPCPGGDPCPFALAEGGGIDSSGPLTLVRTVVSGNAVGAASGLPDASSDADGGGIAAHGTLTLVDSDVTSNQAWAAAPNGRFAEGAGIFADGPSSTMRGGDLSGNVAKLAATRPAGVDQEGIGAAMQVGNAAATTTLDGVAIKGNSLLVTNTAGDAVAFGAGPHIFGTLVMRDSMAADNRIVAAVPAGAPGAVSATSGGIEIDDDGTVVRSVFRHNSLVATGPNDAVGGGAGIEAVPLEGEAIAIRDTVVSANPLVVRGGGTVTALGAGIQNGGELTLDRVTVERNALTVERNPLTASGPAGTAEGGGIWNGRTAFDGAPAGPVLTLRHSTVRRDVVTSSADARPEGGGLFTDAPVTLIDTPIAANVPDQCSGC